MSEPGKQAPIVNPSAVAAAGLASTGAAALTSTFGVAGTLIGAALTTMIITGGSAILRAYMESAAGKMREVPDKVRSRANRQKAGRPAEQPTIAEGPGLRENFVGRLRSALGWFSRLPSLRRRSILVRGLIGALVAFAIGMAAITAVEAGIGNSLSCGLWSNCPAGATPGIGGARADGTSGNQFSLFGGRTGTGGDQFGPSRQQYAPQQGVPGRGAPVPGQQNPPGAPAVPNVPPNDAGQQQDPSRQ